MDIKTKIKLNNGVEMPIFGLGVWQMENGKETEQAITWALEAGYRLIDTAALYRNEESVGKAIRDSGIPRKEIFVTTKLKNGDHDDPESAFETSLKKLDIEYIDLYLIHWPVPEKRKESWKILEKILESGKVKAIGVSNYTIQHLEELFSISEVIPSVNQVEFHPFLYQKELLEFCNKHNIVFEAYSPLTQGYRLNDPTIVATAEKYKKTPAQILIRWGLQHGVVSIPKSSKKERILENADVFNFRSENSGRTDDFEISIEDMKKLDSLDQSEHFSWNPTNLR